MRKPVQEYTDLAHALGITRYRATKLGKHECRRLLSMDATARKLVMISKKARKPIVGIVSVERMMDLADKRRA